MSAGKTQDRGFYVSPGGGGEIVITKWSPDLARALAETRSAKLRISDWQEPGLEALVPFCDQIVRIFVECDIADLSAVAQLTALEELNVRGGLETIDFSRVRHLKTLAVSDRAPRFGSLSACPSLRVLSITDCGLPDLTPLSGLSALTELEVSEAPLKSLVGITGMRSLTRLALLQVPIGNLEGLQQATDLSELVMASVGRLLSIAPATMLPRLKMLDIDGARRVADVERIGEMTALEDLRLTSVSLPSVAFLSRLSRLKQLVLNSVGRIPSLSFLRGLAALESFAPGLNTIVEDGDMSILLELPALKRVTYTERRHYRPRWAEISSTLISRHTWGVGSFENAMAQEWIAMLEKRDPVSLIGNTLREATAYGDDGEVPALVGQYAIAAAELVARLKELAPGGNPLPDLLERWLRDHPIVPPTPHVEQAIAALERIARPPSGLLRVWETRGNPAAWLEQIADLKRRLLSA